jgi:modulator of FtsH protease
MADINVVKHAATQDALLGTHTVLRNTYGLLGLTLIFSGLTAYFAMQTNAQPNIAITLVSFGLLFAIQAFKNSTAGLFLVFAFTGLLGYSLGPILNMYSNNLSNGSEIIMAAFGGTGIIFFALSGYVLSTRKNLEMMTGMMSIMSIVLLLGVIGNLFFQIPMLSLMISAGFILFSSAAILYETSKIIHGGERNYIMATVSLYLSLFNLFVSLLHILGALTGRRD